MQTDVADVYKKLEQETQLIERQAREVLLRMVAHEEQIDQEM